MGRHDVRRDFLVRHGLQLFLLIVVVGKSRSENCAGAVLCPRDKRCERMKQVKATQDLAEIQELSGIRNCLRFGKDLRWADENWP